MKQKDFWTNVAVLLLNQFEFAPFRGKIIVVVGSCIPECNECTFLFEFIQYAIFIQIHAVVILIIRIHVVAILIIRIHVRFN